MGALTKNPTQSVNPNSQEMQGLQADFATFLQGLMGSPNAGSGPPKRMSTGNAWADSLLGDKLPFEPQSGGAGGANWAQNASQMFTSPLQTMATSGIQQFLSQPSPEVETFNKLSGGLEGIFGLDTAAATGAAAMPLFQQGLQFAQGQLANSGRGRFSTAFENQGIGLSQRALQDFNLLQQQAFNQNIGNRLGAANLLGTLSGQAGQAPFNRLATVMGLGNQQAAQNPVLQLLLGGMGFARPAPNETIVGKSPLDHATGLASLGFVTNWGRGGESV